MARQHPIGIFDSGVGGLCIFREIRKYIPNESITYLADSSNCPYGSRHPDETLSLARKNIEFLLSRNCKLIVIACNTVTAVAIDMLRSEYDVPFVGMEPAIKPAALHTRTKKVGVLATENTFNGKLFRQTFARYTNGIDVFIQPGHGLVELVEQGNQESSKARLLLEGYLTPMMDKGADTIVLGCTHYPFYKKMIKDITNGSVRIIDPSDAVAAQTKRMLEKLSLDSDGTEKPGFAFYTTGETATAEKIISETMHQPCRFEQVRT